VAASGYWLSGSRCQAYPRKYTKEQYSRQGVSGLF
jgi:hypothetical protein